jgi:predicted metal-dependent enzyme (double-stranded beta helix superfamily)
MSTSPVPSRCPGLLVSAIRGITRHHLTWELTAMMIAGELERQPLPPAELLTPAELSGDALGYRCHLLHAELDGSFSVLAMVWRPGQATAIHDHVTWCATAVLDGVESEEVFTIAARGSALELVAHRENHPGAVSGLAPPGDIHRVTNCGDEVAVSLHVYGADISRLGSSVRRTYDLPVLVPAG